jgi:ATP-dependent Lhr-like helicase
LGQSLAGFHPLIRRWFTERFGAPTDAQRQAWPIIASGQHVLVSAPTGSGKTLTAFLSVIDNLVTGRWSGGAVRALYLSPLKALNSDIRLNLLAPLGELRALFEREGCPFPPLRVMTRSGDTPDDERRAMLRHPPEILITTPESLNLMLTGSSSRKLFVGIRTVILDEIHALAASKRGTYMMAAVERLTLAAGEFQRVALSATVRPAEAVAAWMAGFARRNTGPDQAYAPRPVSIVHATDARAIALTLRSPDVDVPRGPDAADLRWAALADDLKAIIARNRATLVFANSRRTVEKIARLLNAGEAEPIAYSHHGSLSREIRLDVEERMKQGRLRAVVATGSLELGIDIGSVDEVVLVGTPPSVAQSLQRIGRADHRVGGTSKASLFILHGLDGAQAVSMEGMVRRGAVEELHPIRNALDVLGQVLLSMGCQTLWNLDELYAFVRTMAAYHELPRRHFDLVIAMLAGRYADVPIRELKPRALVDPVGNTFTTRAGTEFVLYQSGGTIPDRGYYHLRLADSKAVIGELDEEFVWERRLGEQFSLGTQSWRILNITHNDVEVGPADANGPMIPFWKADEQNRSTQASFALLDFFDLCESNIGRADFAEALRSEHGMDAPSANSLVHFLSRQRETSGAPLPGRLRVLVECTKNLADATQMQQVVLHTFWGGRVNRPLAMILAEAWEKAHPNNSTPLECFATNDQILLMLPDGVDPVTLFDLVSAEAIDQLLRAHLEKTALFGSRFRENASRALLLPRGDAKKRYPLWLNRLRSKKLLASVLRFEDFPILLETWRDLLEDEFELSTLAGLLDDIAAKRIALHVTRPAHPTPFCDGVVFRQTNYHMYLDDAPGAGGRSNLADELFKDLFHGASTLPAVPEALAAAFASKLLRTYPGYQPATREEILLAVREIPLLPATVVDEWLAQLTQQEAAPPTADPLASLVVFTLPGASQALVADLGDMPRILALRGVGYPAIANDPTGALAQVHPRFGEAREAMVAFLRAKPYRPTGESLATLIGELLRSRAAVLPAEISATLGIALADLPPLLDELLETESIVSGQLIEGRSERFFCDAENAERLLRLHRASRRAQAQQALAPRPPEDLPHFLAEWQGLARQGSGLEPLQAVLDRLFGFPLAAELWEEAILPSRLEIYYPSWLDTLFQSYGLTWFGCGRHKLSLAFASDHELLLDKADPHGEGAGADVHVEAQVEAQAEAPGDDRTRAERAIASCLQATERGLGFFDLATATGADTAVLGQALWDLAWQGRATSDSYETVRRGILSDFSCEVASQTSGRTGFRRWERSRPSAGTWRALHGRSQRSPLARAELEKERARLVLARYGVVFRERLEHELPPLRWSKIFRALRLLELSGEIVCGHFFTGVPGLQFATHEAIRKLAEALPGDRIYFVNACDPASLCGLGLTGTSSLPRRVPSNWMVYRGTTLVLVLQKGGRELTVLVPPSDDVLEPALGIYRFLLGREFSPQSSLSVETINDTGTLASPYAEALRHVGFTNDYRGMSLWKR